MCFVFVYLRNTLTFTYRVYEAMSAGSTPVIEDVTTSGHCDATPWRLLKKHGPPAIFVKSWDQLPKILAKERRLVQFRDVAILKTHSFFSFFDSPVISNLHSLFFSPLPTLIIPYLLLFPVFIDIYALSMMHLFTSRYSKQYKALRRLRVFQWYEWFKLKMRDRFISIISSTLLRPSWEGSVERDLVIVLAIYLHLFVIVILKTYCLEKNKTCLVLSHWSYENCYCFCSCLYLFLHLWNGYYCNVQGICDKEKYLILNWWCWCHRNFWTSFLWLSMLLFFIPF